MYVWLMSSGGFDAAQQLLIQGLYAAVKAWLSVYTDGETLKKVCSKLH